ncbi:esterase-like activity of phytase family protein [Antarcticirhabdus aurantiaca]|uniref:Esterase-like activity of phytase family protein n=1 Tax=Antarcticirhabdus aurantiaca TaxID=2606717 RepID=A0ACD4NSY5_9HYPH|nr:esterase-like activity of phytase family protein [Antarcticirhabdus aurantiaca]WAJ29887.1 esterase-like activity of phytase family protein [Jeongeuplla avenae]
MRPRRQRHGAVGLLALLTLAFASVAPSPAPAEPVEVSVAPIHRFCGADLRDLVGGLRFVGGFAYSGVSGVSSFRFLDAGSQFLAVTDTGYWFTGRIARDGDDRPIGIEDAETTGMRDVDGRIVTGKIATDAEALAIGERSVLVGFEREARILAFDRDDPIGAVPTLRPLPIPREELRANGGIETIALSPRPDWGGVAVAEKSIDAEGNLFAGRFGAANPAANGVFTVKRGQDWDATDGVFLPSGDLLLLERQYTGLFGRIGTRIRRIPAAELRAGALADGPVIAEADLSCEIDNMEGIDLFEAPDGTTRLALVSDDNNSFLQRSLYLEFRLDAAD